jgi:flagellar assembly protein FliH
MAKAVFRPGEVVVSDAKIFLDPPQAFSEMEHLAPLTDDPEELEEVEEYSGPTADDLRREAEEFKIQWEVDREAMIRAAQTEANAVVKEAEDQAQGIRERNVQDLQGLKQDAEAEAERILAAAREKAAEIQASAQSAFEDDRKKAGNEGREAGREAGYVDGKAEVERLIQRTQTVLERAQDKRGDILAESEQQIVDLVLLLARKVVKVISETQRNVVVSNVVQALRKIKARGNVLIRVNLADLKLTTEHTKDFIRMVEGVQNIQVLEDSTVDQGGCIVETDFGEVDARIASQLAELEDKILELSPIKGKAKSASSLEGA